MVVTRPRDMLGELARPMVAAGVKLKRKFSSGRETTREWKNPVEKDHAGMLIQDWSISDITMITYAHE